MNYFKLVRTEGRPDGQLFLLSDKRIIPAELKVEKYTHIHNASPDGYNWGYAGSGPAQAAFVMVLEYFRTMSGYTADKAIFFAERLHQKFKDDFLVNVKASDDIIMSQTSIDAWITMEDIKPRMSECHSVWEDIMESRRNSAISATAMSEAGEDNVR